MTSTRDPIASALSAPVAVTVPLTAPDGTPVHTLRLTLALDGLSREHIRRAAERAVPGSHAARMDTHHDDNGVDREYVCVIDQDGRALACGPVLPA